MSGCGQHAPPETFALGPIVAQHLSALPEPVAALAATEPDTDLIDRIEGLLQSLRSTKSDIASAARAEITDIGESAIAPLSEIVGDPERPADQRLGACELLALIGSNHAALALLEQVERSPDAWLRAQCAWRLGQMEADWIVPRLLLRLKYEKDWESVIWIADTLAHFGNYSGCFGLLTAVASAPDEALRASAYDRLRSHGTALGLFSEDRVDIDVEQVRTLWTGIAATEINTPKRSPEYQREVWRYIEGFAEFQLRGVDDGRFVLSRLDALDALTLGSALHDENRYVRVHVAQSLERMGPRASLAFDELRAALTQPDLAIYAAEALGALGDTSAVPALLARLAPSHTADLRLSAIRALTRLDTPEVASALRAILLSSKPAELPELRQAAAESLTYLTGAGGIADPDALPVLIHALGSSDVDPQTSEEALEWLLNQRVEAKSTDADHQRERWTTLASEEIDAVARRSSYAEIAASWIAQ